MLDFITGSKIVQYLLAGLAIVGGVMLAVWRIFAAGKAAEKADVVQKNAEVTDAQLQAQADRPRTDDQLDQRLRGDDPI